MKIIYICGKILKIENQIPYSLLLFSAFSGVWIIVNNNDHLTRDIGRHYFEKYSL